MALKMVQNHEYYTRIFDFLSKMADFWYFGKCRKCTELFGFLFSRQAVHFPKITRKPETVTETHGLTNNRPQQLYPQPPKWWTIVYFPKMLHKTRSVVTSGLQKSRCLNLDNQPRKFRTTHYFLEVFELQNRYVYQQFEIW